MLRDLAWITPYTIEQKFVPLFLDNLAPTNPTVFDQLLARVDEAQEDVYSPIRYGAMSWQAQYTLLASEGDGRDVKFYTPWLRGETFTRSRSPMLFDVDYAKHTQGAVSSIQQLRDGARSPEAPHPEHSEALKETQQGAAEPRARGRHASAAHPHHDKRQAEKEDV